MNIVVRLLIGSGIFILGYYLGREVSRGQFIDQQLEQSKSSTRLHAKRAGD